MNSTKVLILLVLLVNTLKAQSNLNLSKYIDSLEIEDQKWRKLIRQIENSELDTISRNSVLNKMNTTDSLNFIAVNSIFKKYGFPGYTLVGMSSSHNFWLLIQHADKYPDFQDNVLLKMKLEVDGGNASPSDYAYLVDRVKINTQQLQVFGTQMELDGDSSSFVPKPVIDPDRLNERRKSMGLTGIDDYIELMNKTYYGSLKKNNK